MLAHRKFQVGDKVLGTAYTDCFGAYHPETEVLTVISVQTIGPDISSVPHHRLKAAGDGGEHWHWVEASERFFIPAK